MVSFPLEIPKWARSPVFAGSLLFLAAVALLAATQPAYGVTFDEPIYHHAAQQIKAWLGLPFSGMLDARQIDVSWRCDQFRNIHPSGVKWMYLAAQSVIVWKTDPFVQNRWLSILLVSASLVLFFQWAFPKQPAWSGASIG